MAPIYSPDGEVLSSEKQVRATQLFSLCITENAQIAILWNDEFLGNLKSRTFLDRKKISKAIYKAVDHALDYRLLGVLK